MLSLEALQESVMLVWVRLLAVSPVGVLGALVSDLGGRFALAIPAVVMASAVNSATASRKVLGERGRASQPSANWGQTIIPQPGRDCQVFSRAADVFLSTAAHARRSGCAEAVRTQRVGLAIVIRTLYRPAAR